MATETQKASIDKLSKELRAEQAKFKDQKEAERKAKAAAGTKQP